LGLDEGVKEVGGGFEVAAKFGFRDVAENGRVPLAVVAGQQGLVVRDQLSAQAHKEQGAKQQQAPKSEAIALEAQPGAA